MRRNKFVLFALLLLGVFVLSGCERLINLVPRDLEVVDIEVNPPLKLDYYVGDDLNTEGLEVYKVLEDNSKVLLNDNEYQINGFDSKEAKQIEIIITYKSFKKTFNVNILKRGITSYTIYIDDNKVEYKDLVEFNFINNDDVLISLIDSENYSFSFISVENIVLSTSLDQHFKYDESYHYEVHLSSTNTVRVVFIDEDDTYLKSIYKDSQDYLNVDETLEVVNLLNPPSGTEVISWNVNLPMQVEQQIVIRPLYDIIDYPYDASIMLDQDFIVDNDQIKFTGNIHYANNLKLIEVGVIVYETDYFINQLTVNNIYSKTNTINLDDLNNNNFVISSNYEDIEKINARAYLIVEGLSGRREVVYSDTFITPYQYADDLFFSYYLEGTSYNKALGIFNGTGKDINLSGYKILRYSNGSTEFTTHRLSGILPHGEVFIIANPRIEIGSIEDKINNGEVQGYLNGFINFDGNDSLELVNNEQVLDRIGTIGVDHDFGKDVSYKRSPNVKGGNIYNWTADDLFTFESDEWISEGQDGYNGLLSHSFKKLAKGDKYIDNILNDSINEVKHLIYYLQVDGINKDINLPQTSINHPNVLYNWISSDENIFSNTGSYLKPISQNVITLKLEIYVNGELQDYSETLEVIVHPYYEEEVIFDVNLDSLDIDGWEFYNVSQGMMTSSDAYIMTSSFVINNFSTLFINTINTDGVIRVIGLDSNDNNIFVLSKLLSGRDEYKITLNNLNIEKIKIEYVSGAVVINSITLIENNESGNNDFTPPVIVVSIPRRYKIGSKLELEEIDYYVFDDFDSDIDVDIDLSKVNFNITGEYVIIFTALDSSGNIRVLEIYIEVYDGISYYALSEDPDEVIVKFIDIGKYYAPGKDSEQGESTYIKIGDIDILVDAGMRYNYTYQAIKEVLDENVTGKLDYIIATHPHADHIGGFPRILSEYEVETAIIFATQVSRKSNILVDFLEGLDENVPNVCTIADIMDDNNDKGYCVQEYNLAPSVSLRFLDTGYYLDKDENSSSLVFVLEAFETKVLLNGDAESNQEKNYAPLAGEINIFKLGHHGSRNGTSEFLLKQINPEVAIVSNGSFFGNKHGHPTFEVINRIYQYNNKIKIYATTGGGTAEDRCVMDGLSYRCEGNNIMADRNGNISTYINNEGYYFITEFQKTIIEFSSTHFWQNHPKREYSYLQ